MRRGDNHFSILRGFPHAFDINKSRVILTAVNTPLRLLLLGSGSRAFGVMRRSAPPPAPPSSAARVEDPQDERFAPNNARFDTKE
jgi:hypothetical protein